MMGVAALLALVHLMILDAKSLTLHQLLQAILLLLLPKQLAAKLQPSNTGVLTPVFCLSESNISVFTSQR